MKPVLFLDLDGVLVDFVGGALAHHGRHLPMHAVRWNFPEQVGFAKDCPTFWNTLGHDFWANLEWTPEGKSVVKVAEEIFADNVVIMTSPCDTPGAVEGKIAWIKKNMPKYRRRFFVGPPKALAASPSKILCDDHEGNVDQFLAEGGRAVLVPRPWNHRREETTDGYQFDVTRLGDELAIQASRIVMG